MASYNTKHADKVTLTYAVTIFCDNVPKLFSDNISNGILPLTFTSLNTNQWTLKNYLTRINRYCDIQSIHIYATIYQWLLLIKSRNYLFNQTNIYSIIGTMTILFSKMYYDEFYEMRVYARILDINSQDLYGMEITMFSALGWNLYVKYDTCVFIKLLDDTMITERQIP